MFIINFVGEEIIRNLIEVVMYDLRFLSVKKEELDDIDIFVDVLMDLVLCEKNELDFKKYGVIVFCGMWCGLLLLDFEGVDIVEE